MKWFKKYTRTFNKQEFLNEIKKHEELLGQANSALEKLEKLSLDGEEHWLEEAELECTFDNVKLKRNSSDGTFSGITRAHCRP
jgi:hypothetical protein